MITIKLNSELFSSEKIFHTQKIYAGYADIMIEYDEKYWILKFSNCRYDEEMTSREFENYLIGLENS